MRDAFPGSKKLTTADDFALKRGPRSATPPPRCTYAGADRGAVGGRAGGSVERGVLHPTVRTLGRTPKGRDNRSTLHPGGVLLLLPSDPLRSIRSDPHFADEGAAAHGVGVDVALVDHDALQGATNPGVACTSVRHVPPGSDVVYRGWMITADRYAMLAQALTERGARLRTSPTQYRRGHELPGWSEALSRFAPQACWTVGADLAAFSRCLAEIGSGPAVLRDYTKSLKHQWRAAAFIPDVADNRSSRQVAERFLELRGDAFDGGLVLRRFEEFTTPEVRTWWVDGRCVLSTAHPDTPDEQPEVPQEMLRELTPVIASLALPFATADLVKRSDGCWRVIEVGDGQVSDRPRSCPAAALVRVLTRSAGAAAAS